MVKAALDLVDAWLSEPAVVNVTNAGYRGSRWRVARRFQELAESAGGSPLTDQFAAGSLSLVLDGPIGIVGQFEVGSSYADFTARSSAIDSPHQLVVVYLICALERLPEHREFRRTVAVEFGSDLYGSFSFPLADDQALRSGRAGREEEYEACQ